MIDKDILTLIEPIIDCLAELKIPYQIGGSIASSAYGLGRSTVDADIVAGIRNEHVPPLVARLKRDYFIQADAIREAVRYQKSFNIIHLETMFKTDVFIFGKRRFDVSAISRKKKESLDEDNRFNFYLTSPEDTVLYKLEWYKKGGCISDRQWQDLVGVLKVQKHNLDKGYLLKWAQELEISDLLEKAFADSGFEEKDED